ncbi:MAG: SAVED domain-containing protein [Aestuariivita sp.]|nr:SAVED domain-containing protein [Aestuariivita sp.]MCY4202806.1 SAVED domain-containing protein [Aestuariivita sp.]
MTGVLLDDEGTIVIEDWDRDLEAWRKIEGEDDGACFVVDGLDAISDAAEGVLTIHFSYPVNDEDLATTFALQRVNLTLNSASSDGHWSQQKQNRLSQVLFEGAKRIHPVLAAPNSVVFTFGRRYDKRNLPEAAVYQFRRS